MKTLPSLFVITVNWNLKSDTLDCLDSLFVAGAPIGNVVLVDNASTDGTVDAVKDRYGGSVIILVSEKNLGYGGGLNLGIDWATRQGAEWLLLVNNDTLFDSDFFHQLACAVGDHPEYSLWTPRIDYYSKDSPPSKIWSLGDRLILNTMLTWSPYKNQVAPQNLPQVLEVDFITGCAMLVNSEVILQVGLFDPSIFMYAEEVDFVMRARIKGFRCAAAPYAIVSHKVSKSTGGDQRLPTYWRLYNQIGFYRKYASRFQQLLLSGFTLGRGVLHMLKFFVQRKPELIPPIVRAWFDGWMKGR